MLENGVATWNHYAAFADPQFTASDAATEELCPLQEYVHTCIPVLYLDSTK